MGNPCNKKGAPHGMQGKLIIWMMMDDEMLLCCRSKGNDTLSDEKMYILQGTKVVVLECINTLSSLGTLALFRIVVVQ